MATSSSSRRGTRSRWNPAGGAETPRGAVRWHRRPGCLHPKSESSSSHQPHSHWSLQQPALGPCSTLSMCVREGDYTERQLRKDLIRSEDRLRWWGASVLIGPFLRVTLPFYTTSGLFLLCFFPVPCVSTLPRWFARFHQHNPPQCRRPPVSPPSVAKSRLARWSDAPSFLRASPSVWLTRLVSCRCSCYCLFVTSVVCLLSSPFPPSDFGKVLDQGIWPKQASHTPIPIQVGVTSPVWFLSLSPFLGQDCASACFGFPLFLVIPFNKVFDQINLGKQMLSPTTHTHKNLLYGVCSVCFFSTRLQTTDRRCYLQTSWRTGYR